MLSRAFATLAKSLLPADHRFVVLLHDTTRQPPENTSMISNFTEEQLAAVLADTSAQLNQGLKPSESYRAGRKPN